MRPLFLTVVLLACACESKRPQDPPTSEIKAPVKTAGPHVSGDNYEIDAAPAECKAAAECTVAIKLATKAEYHINKEYPYKFAATAAPGVEFLGKGDANAFTKAAGDFVEQGEKVGVMTVRFKPAAAGEAKVGGTYKFSVCSADRCQIEQEKLEVSVRVL